MSNGISRIAVIGGGAWGSALAIHLARAGGKVRLWIRETDVVQAMRRERMNPLYLPGIRFPEGVDAFAEIEAALEGAELVLVVVPSQFARGVYREMALHLPERTPCVIAAKGIEQESLALPLDVAGEILGRDRPMAVLSGPSFASEVAEGLPTAVVIASIAPGLAEQVQRAISSPVLRLYTNADPVGVQVAGALKNVMALAAGMADGLEMGANTSAALITRGLSEISRLGIAMGGRPETFSGLAGLGDLVLTCTGGLSRNRRTGQRLGRGERLDEILEGTHAVVEGVHTTRSSRELAARMQIEMPIVEEVHRILFEGGSPRASLGRLMSRPLIPEHPAP